MVMDRIADGIIQLRRGRGADPARRTSLLAHGMQRWPARLHVGGRKATGGRASER